jgi:hypothetical protein
MWLAVAHLMLAVHAQLIGTELEKVARLHSEGMLTVDEFRAAKAHILGEPSRHLHTRSELQNCTNIPCLCSVDCYSELVVGVGNAKKKKLGKQGEMEYKNPVTLDLDPLTKPMVSKRTTRKPILRTWLKFGGRFCGICGICHCHSQITPSTRSMPMKVRLVHILITFVLSML